MPFQRPTRTEQIARIRQDLATRLQIGEAQVRRTNLGVLAHAQGEAAFSLAGYISWLALQVIIDTAEAEILDRHGDIWGIARKPAVAATGNVTFTGTNGTTIPAGTALQRADQVAFATDADVVIATGTATAAATASVPAAASDTDAAETLSLVAPISGVDGVATVAAGGLSNGADVETDTSLRARLIDRIQTPPQGGAGSDYLKWVQETPGVTVAYRGPDPADAAAWVYPLELGLGTVSVRFMVDDGAGGMRVPTAPEIAAVQAYIDARRPVTADVTVVAPIAVALNFTIQLLPDSADIRAAVEAELRDLILREAEPGGTILLSHIQEAISVAAGETDHVLTVPAANVTHTTGQIATFGAITWV